MRLFILLSFVLAFFFLQGPQSLAQEQPNGGHESTSSPDRLSATHETDCHSVGDIALNDNTTPGGEIVNVPAPRSNSRQGVGN